MKTAASFDVTIRENSGRGASRALRLVGKVPATLYGKGKKPVSIEMDAGKLTLEYLKGGFRNKIVELNAGKEKFFALPREVQLHPVSDKVEHADFQFVDAKTPVRVAVPVHVLNTEKSIGIKRGGVLNIVRHAVELVCTPDKIPPFIEVDVLKADIGTSIHISAVKLPEGVTPAIKSRDFTVVTIAGRGKEEEEAPAAAAAAAATAAAGAAPAAGAAAAPAAGAKPAAGAAAAKPAAKK